MNTRTTTTPPYHLWQMVLYMLRLGTLGFGGPVALVGYMQRDLVEDRGWISEADYKEGLALAQLAPGPLAAQLGIYLGYVHYRLLGATLAGLAFVLPSFLMVVALGWAYVRFGGLPWMQAVFYGVGAAVSGIIAMSTKKLAQKTLGKDRLLWAIFALLAAGEFASIEEAQAKLCPRYRIVKPDPREAAVYEDLYRIYKKLYFGFGQNGAVTSDMGDVLPSLRKIASASRQAS